MKIEAGQHTFEGKIGVIGLGYVGLPLACLFASEFEVIGFDINDERIIELRSGNDRTNEVNKDLLQSRLTLSQNKGLEVTSDILRLSGCQIYIITVPTPIDAYKKPDLSPLILATEMVGSILKNGDIVIFESTVYPGTTEEECVPILEEKSNLAYNKEFFVGYSPERINPGDNHHTIEKIKKVTSGSTEEVAHFIDWLYNVVIAAGTYMAPSIKVAEAAKVIENAQRDINIAFVNELAKIFNLMQIDTDQVLQAAATKWNFLPFKPGLVGGHCIGVDPYYLSHKAQEYGYHPEIILAGRRLNDGMGEYVASQVVKLMLSRDLQVKGASVLILGITFKENCTDVRNTKVVDVIDQFVSFGCNVTICDPLADAVEVDKLGFRVQRKIPEMKFDAIVLTVAHKAYLAEDLRTYMKTDGVLYDVKSALPYKVDGKL